MGAGFRYAEVLARPYVGGHVQARVSSKRPLDLRQESYCIFILFIGDSSLFLAKVLVKQKRAWTDRAKRLGISAFC